MNKTPTRRTGPGRLTIQVLQDSLHAPYRLYQTWWTLIALILYRIGLPRASVNVLAWRVSNVWYTPAALLRQTCLQERLNNGRPYRTPLC